MSDPPASLISLSHAPVLVVRGADVVDLLQRISTNDMSQLAGGHSVVTLFTTEKGRVAEAAHVMPMAEHQSFLLILFGVFEGDFCEWLSRYIIMEDVRFGDRPISSSHYLLYAADFAQPAISDNTLEELRRNRYISVRETFRGRVWFRIVDQDGDARSHQFLSDLLGVPIVTHDDFEKARIEAGIPLAGKELTELFNPMETLCREYISFTKGCYVGQEVVARLDSYHKVSRALVRLCGTGKARTGPVVSQGKEAGLVTSAIQVNDNEWIGLGFLREFAVKGSDLAMAHEGTRVYVVDEDPFKSVYGGQHG